MVYLIFLCIALPLLLMLPILEGRSRRLIGFLLLGLTTALAGFELNTMLFAWSGLDTIRFPLIVTPMTEEVLKALPVGVYAMLIGISARIRTEQINPLCAVLRGKLGDNCFNLFNLYFRVITLASLHGILSL